MFLAHPVLNALRSPRCGAQLTPVQHTPHDEIPATPPTGAGEAAKARVHLPRAPFPPLMASRVLRIRQGRNATESGEDCEQPLGVWGRATGGRAAITRTPSHCPHLLRRQGSTSCALADEAAGPPASASETLARPTHHRPTAGRGAARAKGSKACCPPPLASPALVRRISVRLGPLVHPPPPTPPHKPSAAAHRTRKSDASKLATPRK